MNIEISISTTILANIPPKYYYQVKVMAFFVDFVPYKYQKRSKLSCKNQCRFQAINIVLVSKNQYHPALAC